MRTLGLLLLFLSISAEAKILIWPYNPSLRLERHENQNLKFYNGYFHGVGFLVERWYGSLESENYQSRTSDGNVSIKRDYQDLKLWGGYSLFQFPSWHFLGLAGLGLYKEQIETKVGSVEDLSTSDQKTLFGLGAELLYSSKSAISFGIGARFYWGEDLDPYPQPGLYLKLGLQF